MNYGELLSEAFWITWRNRFLWFFGFFAAGSSSSFNVPSNFGNVPGDTTEFAGVGRWISENIALFVTAIIVVVVLLVLIFIVLHIVSAGGLADSVAAIDREERRSFSSTWRAGTSNFWRVLAQALLLLLIALGLLLLIALVGGVPIWLVFTLSQATGARVLVAVVFGILAVGLFIVVFIPFYIIGQFALRGLVVGRERITHSIAAGYGLFRRNIGRSLLLWLISIALSIGIGIAFLIVLVIVGLVLFLPAILLAFADYTTAAIVAGVVAGVILLPALLVLAGAIGTFSHAYWTLAYLRLTGYPEGSEPAQTSTAA